MADDLTTPPPSYEKVDLESVMVTPTAPPLYPVLPSAESPLPLGVRGSSVCGVCVFMEYKCNVVYIKELHFACGPT